MRRMTHQQHSSSSLPTRGGQLRVEVDGRLHVRLDGGDVQAAAEGAHDEHGGQRRQLRRESRQVHRREAALKAEQGIYVPEPSALRGQWKSICQRPMSTSEMSSTRDGRGS